jgi:CRISPR-associated protein Cpf1
VQNALQLTPPVDNFSDIEKAQQYWIMLYTRANYTSQTDPKTGRRKTIYLKRWRENIKAQICEKFDEFGFDWTDYYFKYKVINTGKTWTLYSGKDWKSLDRFRRKLDNDTNIWKTKRVDVVSILDWIFEKYWKSEAFKFIIDKKNWMINNEQWQKIELTKITDKDINKDWHTAWESLMFAIDLIQQIRNSWPKNTDWAPTKDDDFILSPVRDGDWITGNHFDSREFLDASPCLDWHNPKMPTSWDANGAFNIARKGLMMLKRIAENPEKPNLFISDEEWDERLSEHSE